jgi:hypothetical protein
VDDVLHALLFLPALVAIAFVLLRPRPGAEILAETAAPPENPFDTLETLLGELERTTLEERDPAELEALAEELERTAARLERVA